MESLWQDSEAGQFQSVLELRAYTSRLLGRNADLVLHGGGNTSAKDVVTTIFGESEQVLYIKGSGHDLKTIGTDGFAPTRLAYLQQLAQLPALSDTEMMRELKVSQLDPKAPTPSVEAILHAIIPHRFVDHTHADAVVAISNTAGGEERIRSVFGDDVLVLPYVMPGFILARQVYEATAKLDWNRCRGIVLLHHGVFTFHEEARQSYENMLKLVTMAEDYLHRNAASLLTESPSGTDPLEFARLRKKVAESRGGPIVGRFRPLPFARLDNVAECGRRGPITPDHVLHTKRVPMLMTGDSDNDVVGYAHEYRDYFAAHASPQLTCLDPAPRWGIYPDHGVASFGINGKRLQICSDIVDHTVKAVQWGEQLGGWEALPARDIFELEYWELEQAKLGNQQSSGDFEGRTALVTGAASGIGRATAELLVANGACVIGVDLAETVSGVTDSPLFHGIVADLTDSSAVATAFSEAVLHFGGIDILVSNAGSFPDSGYLDVITDEQWDDALRVNLDSHFKVLREATRYLKVGISPAVVIVASKNVLAPGPGVGPYSVAKAGITQLARVAALELAEFGIRVNVLHPDAVFDTGIWSDDVLAARAANYKMSVDEYKRRNLLSAEIAAADVAQAVLALTDRSFARSTGLQLTIDGGSDRTI